MRNFLTIVFSISVVLAVIVGCSDDANLKPLITRIEANVDCSVAPVDVQFVAFVTGGNPTADPTGASSPLNLVWDFQDGHTGTGTITTHRFTEPGDYEVTATVTDDDGDSHFLSTLVEVLSDSLFVESNTDTTVTASMAFFDTPTLGASNGTGGMNIRSTIVINEILAFNESIIQNPINNQYESLLELYNSSTTDTVEIGGWSLTNDPTNPRQWRFQGGTILIPGEHMIVWVDGWGSNTGYDHTNFSLLDEYDGPPEDFDSVLYLYDGAQRLVDKIVLRYQQADVSFGHFPDASDDGLVMLNVTPDLCGFDPEAGLFERFNFTWDMADVLGTISRDRVTSHIFNTADVGDRTVVITVFDTYTSVTRRDTVIVTVESPTP